MGDVGEEVADTVALQVAFAEAERLAQYEGWHRPEKHGLMAFGEMEEGQYFLHMGNPDKTPIPFGGGWGTQAKYQEAITSDGAIVNYCAVDGRGNVRWEWHSDDLLVFGLNVCEEY
jgi:hypothetical protein